MITIKSWLQQATQQLGATSPSAHIDAQVLLTYCLQCSKAYLYTYPEKILSATHTSQADACLQRRLAGEPIAYIVGEQEFWSLPLRVDPSTLIPRADTETLVDVCLQLAPSNSACRVLDLGTGSGAIALALAHERPRWQITAVDRREQAVALARDNATRLQLPITVLHSDWFSAVTDQTFDIIVSNPPYIAADDPHLQQGDVRYEPHSALIADENGLADIAFIIKNSPRFLTKAGLLLIEHGYQQASQCRQLFESAGFVQVTDITDTNSQPRVTAGKNGASC